MGHVALLFCAVFTIWLLRQDVVSRGPMPPAAWVPFLWLIYYSSRPIARWMGGSQASEGNILDVCIQFSLIVSAFWILQNRGFQWGRLLSINPAFFVLFLYFVISIVWTVDPATTFKRLFKEFGNLLIILVILTDVQPAAVFKSICMRCGAILFPLSEVLNKWFPHFGRQYGHSGGGMVTGVTTQKNTLGEICAYYSLVLLWDMLDEYRARGFRRSWRVLLPRAIVFSMGMFMLLRSQSKTALLAFLIGTAILFSTKLRFVRRSPAFWAKFFFATIVIGLVTAAVATELVAPLLESLNRDASFSERTKIWQTVLEQHTNPLIGCGFFSFWLEKGPKVWEQFVSFNMNTAHCGYLEIYLDGGLIGCLLLGVYLLFTSVRAANRFSDENTFSRLVFAMIMMALVINFSETCFFRLGITWCSLVLASLATYPALFERMSFQDQAVEGSAAEFEYEIPIETT